MRNGCLNSPFTGSIQAVTPSQAAVTWRIVRGSLPPGLTGSGSGKLYTISGTPTSVGSYVFALRATLATGEWSERSYSIGVATIGTSSLPDGATGSAYSQTLSISGVVAGNEVWHISSGSLPPGLSLNSVTGEISGTPTTEGDYAFTVCFSNIL